MKEGNNLSYVTKMGAYGLAVAAAFAVALAVLLSVSSTPAEAFIESRNTDGTYTTGSAETGNAQNGDTVYIRNAAIGFVLYEITSIGSASASFTHGDADEDGQSLYCTPATGTTPTCDVDTANAGSTVALKIDDDSGKGAIFVKHTPVGGTTSSTDQIMVTVKQVPTTLTAKANTSSIDAKGKGAAGTTYVDIRLTDANNKGIALEAITIVSTRALLTEVAAEDGDVAATNMRTLKAGSVVEAVTLTAFTGASLAGSVTTTEDAGASTDADNDVDSSGYARVIVTGGGSPGVSTITVTAGELTATANIVLHGVVKTISAELEEGAIEVGGQTRIVVTALDAGDNPVANQEISVKTKGGVTPPEKLAKPVATDDEANKNSGNLQSLADKGDLPACGSFEGATDDAQTDDNEARPGSSGTNDDGQCVIEVSAPGGDTATTTDDAARGTHTIVLVANGTGGDSPKGVNEAEVEIQVGGAPATIEHDGPERIDPSDELTINVTVVDDEGVRVGRVNIEVIHTAGDGAIITDIAARTKDGKAKFTYLAPSTPGVTEFLVRTKNAAGTVVTSQEPIIIAIGDEPVVVEDPPDPPPSLSEAPSATGVTLTSFSGGTVEELKTALTAACSGDGVSAYTTSDGAWNTFIPGAPAQLNATFSELYAAGIPEGKILLVANCGG